MAELRINNRAHLSDFIKLNEQWISEYFKIEDCDKQLAANPESIILNGGYVFTLTINDEVVGCCALFKDKDDEFELARMAVSPAWQGKGLGKQLIDEAINKAMELNARRVYLVSNTKLSAAMALYEKSGFVTIFLGQHPEYARANIIMERVLS